MLDIKIERTTAPKEKPNEDKLGFGQITIAIKSLVISSLVIIKDWRTHILPFSSSILLQ